MGEAMLEEHWSRILQHVNASIQAEQVFCSITTEMKWFPQIERQPILKELHAENYETSYHRNTAAGNLIRLQMTDGTDRDQHKRLILMTVECLLEAKEHDTKAYNFLTRLEADTSQDKAWIEFAAKWHRLREHYLRRAMRRLRMSISDDMWQEGAAMVRLE
jgi:hypothetical protein